MFCKTIVNEIGSLHTVTYSIWAGAAMLTATATATGQFNFASVSALSTGDFFSLLYLGAIGSALAYIWYYQGIQTIGATRSGVFIALNPLTAVLLGALLLGEQLTSPMLIGGALIITGILICNRATPSDQRLNEGIYREN